jgi:hypothetical protein
MYKIITGTSRGWSKKPVFIENNFPLTLRSAKEITVKALNIRQGVSSHGAFNCKKLQNFI